MTKNVIGTYLHGPILSKNSKIADYIIKYGIKRKYGQDIELEDVNDELERKCRKFLFNKFKKD